FIIGAGFSVYQGVSTIIQGESDSSPPFVGYLVIGLSACVEAVSLAQANRRGDRGAAPADHSLPGYLPRPPRPPASSARLEDTAPLIGLGLALAGLILRQVTGSDLWDGLAALLIGALLIAVAVELARTNVGLLIGKQANPGLVDEIRDELTAQPEVLSVV